MNNRTASQRATGARQYLEPFGASHFFKRSTQTAQAGGVVESAARHLFKQTNHDGLDSREGKAFRVP